MHIRICTHGYICICRQERHTTSLSCTELQIILDLTSTIAVKPSPRRKDGTCRNHPPGSNSRSRSILFICNILHACSRSLHALPRKFIEKPDFQNQRARGRRLRPPLNSNPHNPPSPRFLSCAAAKEETASAMSWNASCLYTYEYAKSFKHEKAQPVKTKSCCWQSSRS